MMLKSFLHKMMSSLSYAEIVWKIYIYMYMYNFKYQHKIYNCKRSGNELTFEVYLIKHWPVSLYDNFTHRTHVYIHQLPKHSPIITITFYHFEPLIEKNRQIKQWYIYYNSQYITFPPCTRNYMISKPLDIDSICHNLIIYQMITVDTSNVYIFVNGNHIISVKMGLS